MEYYESKLKLEQNQNKQNGISSPSDCRIHLCLYFSTDFNQLDLTIMSQLGEHILIIPVISKVKLFELTLGR